ncbi:MAG: hypothetical protein Fur0018_15040 [Anaerolineales bacterium]
MNEVNPGGESPIAADAPFSQIVGRWMDAFMHRSMRGWFRFVKTTGLTMPQFSLLMQIRHRGACGISEISERFGITPAATSQLVEKLVQADLLIRTEDPHDRRARVVNISPAGRALIEQGAAERYRWMERLGENLSPEDRETVKAGMLILLRAAETLDDPIPHGP